MATTRARSDGRCFPLVTCMLALCYHALIAALCSYLPQDPVAIGYGVAGYATAGCVISLLGIYGVIVQNRTLICLFSHSLLLDALVSTCTRLLILELFVSTAHSQGTCSDIIESIWTDQKQPSYEELSGEEWQRALWKAGIWCRFALGAVHVACIGLLISSCAAQGTIAIAVRKYGMQIGRSQEHEFAVDRKDFLDEAHNVKMEATQET